MSVDTEARIESAAELSDDARAALRSLILTLADSKRVLGLRYSDRMLGAPTLEAGIAASSMAQDEWGHARLTYALLVVIAHRRLATHRRALAAAAAGRAELAEGTAAARARHAAALAAAFAVHQLLVEQHLGLVGQLPLRL